MKPRYWIPLFSFVVPNIVIGYGFVFPRNKLAGVNELTIGFASTLFFASLTYVIGVRKALREVSRS
jgi:hypothetical protein